MNGTSPINTATAVGAGAVVAPVVSYVASLFHATLPADVQSAVVVLIVAGAHWFSQVIAARSAKAAPAQ
jgi:CBS domain containing-hemolysin-like protein